MDAAAPGEQGPAGGPASSLQAASWLRSLPMGLRQRRDRMMRFRDRRVERLTSCVGPLGPRALVAGATRLVARGFISKDPCRSPSAMRAAHRFIARVGAEAARGGEPEA
jgi:hypothetical protein